MVRRRGGRVRAQIRRMLRNTDRFIHSIPLVRAPRHQSPAPVGHGRCSGWREGMGWERGLPPAPHTRVLLDWMTQLMDPRLYCPMALICRQG